MFLFLYAQENNEENPPYFHEHLLMNVFILWNNLKHTHTHEHHIESMWRVENYRHCYNKVIKNRTSNQHLFDSFRKITQLIMIFNTQWHFIWLFPEQTSSFLTSSRQRKRWMGLEINDQWDLSTLLSLIFLYIFFELINRDCEWN